jgi:hypothetical protein
VSNYTGAAPASPRKTTWRDLGACIGEDPDLFAPDGTTGQWARVIAAAKSICGGCTVVDSCLAWALDTRQVHGIYGGLTEDERWNLLRQEGARRPAWQERGPKKPPPKTLRELFDRHANSSTDGHLLWIGPKTPIFRGRQLTPGKVAFMADRGREPKGMVKRTCGASECVQPLHLADERERPRRPKSAVKAV